MVVVGWSWLHLPRKAFEAMPGDSHEVSEEHEVYVSAAPEVPPSLFPRLAYSVRYVIVTRLDAHLHEVTGRPCGSDHLTLTHLACPRIAALVNPF
jgi:hypothetical protein